MTHGGLTMNSPVNYNLPIYTFDEKGFLKTLDSLELNLARNAGTINGKEILAQEGVLTQHLLLIVLQYWEDSNQGELERKNITSAIEKIKEGLLLISQIPDKE